LASYRRRRPQEVQSPVSSSIAPRRKSFRGTPLDSGFRRNDGVMSGSGKQRRHSGAMSGSGKQRRHSGLCQAAVSNAVIPGLTRNPLLRPGEVEGWRHTGEGDRRKCRAGYPVALRLTGRTTFRGTSLDSGFRRNDGFMCQAAASNAVIPELCQAAASNAVIPGLTRNPLLRPGEVEGWRHTGEGDRRKCRAGFPVALRPAGNPFEEHLFRLSRE